jgi:osmotically-inducible protein OsmY
LVAQRLGAAMADKPSDTDPYLVEHVRDALAHDPRLSELGVSIECAGQTVVLSGALASLERQQAAADIVHELLPDHEVRNETTVSELPEPAATDVEHFS